MANRHLHHQWGEPVPGLNDPPRRRTVRAARQRRRGTFRHTGHGMFLMARNLTAFFVLLAVGAVALMLFLAAYVGPRMPALGDKVSQVLEDHTTTTQGP